MIRVNVFWLRLEDKLLHFAGVVDDTKCIVVTRICMSVHCLEDSQSVHALDWWQDNANAKC